MIISKQFIIFKRFLIIVTFILQYLFRIIKQICILCDFYNLKSVNIFIQLQLNEKEEQLVNEKKRRMTPEEEQQKLLASVKTDNQEISTMDRQNKELDERIRMMQEEMNEIDNELEDQQVGTDFIYYLIN